MTKKPVTDAASAPANPDRRKVIRHMASSMLGLGIGAAMSNSLSAEGGIASLVAAGAQDVYLTDNPQTSGSSSPIGKSIWLKANSNGKYVCADKNLGTDAPLNANRTAPGSWEKFTVVDAGRGYIGLKANANGKYVAALGNVRNSPLEPKYQTTEIGSWEKFKWVSNSDGTISLKANVNGRYVCADKLLGTSVPVVANRTEIGAWEKFTWGE